MAPRFPLAEAPDANIKNVIGDALHVMHRGPPPFQWVAEDGGSLVGCYAPLSFTPSVAHSFFDVAKVVYGAVQPRYRELAILGFSSVLPVPVIVQHHRDIAQQAPTVQLTATQYDAGLAGQVPPDLRSDGEAAAYALGRRLTAQRGPLDEATWREVTAHLSKAEVVGIVHVISGYRWVALLEQVNGEDH